MQEEPKFTVTCPLKLSYEGLRSVMVLWMWFYGSLN